MRADQSTLHTESNTNVCPIKRYKIPIRITISEAIIPKLNTKNYSHDFSGAFLIFYINRLLSIFLEPIFIVAEYGVLQISQFGI